MRYNVYCKSDDINNSTCVYIKVKTGDFCGYICISLNDLNNAYYAKDCIKTSFNIFEAKQIIASKQASDKQKYPRLTPEYWIEEVKY